MENEFKYIDEFINEIDIVCPKCMEKAIVTSNKDNRTKTKLICGHCGLAKPWKGQPGVFAYGSYKVPPLGILIGQPVDCYFKQDLWYQKTFKSHVLFAYNLNHLHFLEEYVSDKQRNRQQKDGSWSNSSLQSRLPKWMLHSKNRKELLRLINELKLK